MILCRLRQQWCLAPLMFKSWLRPCISAYDPSTESMLAHASPSYKIVIMVTGLVIGCLWTNLSLVLKKISTKTNLIISLSKQPLTFIYVLFIILQIYLFTPTKYF